LIVAVQALFSNSSKPVAQLIAKGTRHLAPTLPEVSHVALLVNGRWVHESTGSSGVQVLSYDKWLDHHREVGRVTLDHMEYQVLADKFRLIQNKKYDYLGVIYLGLAIIPTFFGLKLPKINKWQNKNRYFCCEALGMLTGQDYSMKAPNQVYKKLKYGK
jgi:hypothetical protein